MGYSCGTHELFVWKGSVACEVGERALWGRHQDGADVVRFGTTDGCTVQHAPAWRGLPEAARDGQMNHIGNGFRQSVQVERRLVRAHRHRSIIAAAAPKPKPNQVIVVSHGQHGHPIDPVPRPLEVPNGGVVVQMRRAVAEAPRLLRREVAALGCSQLGQGAEAGTRSCESHASTFKILEGLCIVEGLFQIPAQPPSRRRHGDRRAGLGVGFGRKKGDKREHIKEKEAKRDMQRATGARRRL